ncbi:hypothetical protein AAFF27_20675 [Xylophilus sp. GW821-FHT01B05]
METLQGYPGANGIVNFAEDFRAGAHVFGASDFPAPRDRLSALQVPRINVRYDFEGQDELLKTTGRIADASAPPR